MNQRIQNRIAQYKKMARTNTVSVLGARSNANRVDSLGEVIRSKKDADEFLAELESAVKRSK